MGSGDLLEAVRETTGHGLQEARIWGKAKLFFLPLGIPIVPPLKGENISEL